MCYIFIEVVFVKFMCDKDVFIGGGEVVDWFDFIDMYFDVW